MKRVILLVACLAVVLAAQTEVTVRAKGVGPNRTEAEQDALRAAVEQAFGTHVSSETEMQNFKLIRDVIRTNTQGYVRSHRIIKETPLRETYEVEIEAVVSLVPMKADAKSLSQRLGGVRFMVYYDPDKMPYRADLVPQLDYTTNRINESLSLKGYRYAEPAMVRKLAQEARNMYVEGQGPLSYVQELAFAADAEFYIDVSNLVISVYQKAVKIYTADANVDLKLYDAGTAEGVSAVVGQTDTVSASWQPEEVWRKAVDNAVQKAMDKLTFRMAKTMGGWANNGYPYLLRFYGVSGYRDLRTLKDKLKNDPRFGGELDIKSAPGFSELNLVFRGTADEAADAVLDYGDQIPAFAGLDVSLFVFNQINFVVPGATAPTPQLGSLRGSIR
jgi:hypothetical protein